MHGLWVAFKAALSLVLLAMIGLMAFLFAHKTNDLTPIGIAAILLFMLALLWAKLKPTSRELGLVGVVISFGFLFLGVQALTNARGYPRVCAGKRLWCEFENALYLLGGTPLAAAPFVALGLFLLYISARLVVRRSVAT